MSDFERLLQKMTSYESFKTGIQQIKSKKPQENLTKDLPKLTDNINSFSTL